MTATLTSAGAGRRRLRARSVKRRGAVVGRVAMLVTAAAADAYRRRFRNVLEHIDAHIDAPLSVDGLAAVAGFSKFHFHRQFSELLGMGVYRYVQLVRLRRATHELAFSDARILDVALASGFESHEAFARAFKKVVGQAPSEFREHPRWDTWHATYRPVIDLRSRHMSTDRRARTVDIVAFPETRVAVLEHHGDPNLIGNTVRAFIEWRRANRLPPQVSATFNIHYSDPNDTPPDEFRRTSGRRRRSWMCSWRCGRRVDIHASCTRHRGLRRSRAKYADRAHGLPRPSRSHGFGRVWVLLQHEIAIVYLRIALRAESVCILPKGRCSARVRRRSCLERSRQKTRNQAVEVVGTLERHHMRRSGAFDQLEDRSRNVARDFAADVRRRQQICSPATTRVGARMPPRRSNASNCR